MIRPGRIRSINRIKLFICVMIFALGGIAQAFSTGPIPSQTGAPGEATCVDCHDKFELNSGPGRVSVENLPKTYAAGQRITVRVSIAQARQKRWGFQITALDMRDQPAGEFVITDTASTQIVSGNGRSYVEHTVQGSRLGTMGGTSWTFDWIAPSSDIGPVNFYVSGNAADGNNDILGDFIYTNFAQIGPPSDPVVSLKSPNGGESLRGGDTFTISWTSTNATAHNLLFQANGVGDVPKTIVSGLDAGIKEFQWKVPNIATSRGRVIVVAEGASGRADSDSSNNDFTIAATQQIPGPTVTSIIVTNKKIKIVGSGLSAGTVLTVNDMGFSKAPKLLDASTFIQKGTAIDGRAIKDLIPVGGSVRIRLTNPDGGVTEVNFVRPTNKSGFILED